MACYLWLVRINIIGLMNLLEQLMIAVCMCGMFYGLFSFFKDNS